MAPKKKGSRRKLNIKRMVLLVALILFLVLFGAGMGMAIGIWRSLPDWEPGSLQMDMTTSLYDKNNNLFASLHGEQNRILVDIDDLPKHLIDAFIATEDHRFYQHHGIDLQAIARAALVNLRSGSIREGGSTITQQLAKNAFIENPERTLRRKIQEAFLALQLERNFTKKEILEQYLNIVYFGHGAYGVQAAARTYFGKDAKDLNLAESALLAGLVQSPGNYSPLIKGNEAAALKRQAQVLDNMVKYGYISPAQAEEAKKQKLTFAKRKENIGQRFPYFVDAVIEEAEKLLEANGIEVAQLYRGGLQIYTTLDPVIQNKIEEVYRDPKNFPPSAPDRLIQSAMVVLDPHTGEIRGLIGGRDYTTQRGLNRAIHAERQPGSTIKPLVVYAPALEKGYPPAYVLDDVPVTFPSQPKPYSPRNYDHRYRGLISMREAIRWSVNTAAVKMLHTIGVDSGFEFGKRLGLPLIDQDRNLSLALGGLTRGVSPLQMAAAYAAFANQGIYVTPHTIIRITDRLGRNLVVNTPKRRAVMSEQTAYLMTDMLQTVIRSGTGTRAQLGRPAAGKTGTTELPDLPGFKGLEGTTDAWFAGYTPELVAVVWMGYDQTDPKHYLKNVAGGSYPALIWKAVMSTALKNVPPRDFPRPAGIVYADVDAKSGLLPSDLTPKEYIVKEIFTQKMLPQKISDVWVQAQVCAASGQLPSPYCPDIITGVFLRRPVPYEGSIKPEDADLELPKEVCTLHGPGNQEGLVSICTDPRHGGKPVLANIPGPGQSGGCPPQFVAKQQFEPGKAPTEKCSLPDHQLSQATGGQMGSPIAQPPPAPVLQGQVEVLINQNEARVKLTWSIKDDKPYLYSVERRENGNSRQNIAIVKDKTYVDKDVEPGKTYYYRIFALDEQTNLGTPSNEIRVTIPPGRKRN